MRDFTLDSMKHFALQWRCHSQSTHTSLLICFQGEEKTSEKDKESSTEEKKSDTAEAPPDDGLTDEVRERKRLSLAAQQVCH